MDLFLLFINLFFKGLVVSFSITLLLFLNLFIFYFLYLIILFTYIFFRLFLIFPFYSLTIIYTYLSAFSFHLLERVCSINFTYVSLLLFLVVSFFLNFVTLSLEDLLFRFLSVSALSFFADASDISLILCS